MVRSRRPRFHAAMPIRLAFGILCTAAALAQAAVLRSARRPDVNTLPDAVGGPGAWLTGPIPSRAAYNLPVGMHPRERPHAGCLQAQTLR